MTSLTIELGDALFEFASYIQWVNKARSWFQNSGVPSYRTICIDQRGRICKHGRDFIRADKESAFPITVYELA